MKIRKIGKLFTEIHLEKSDTEAFKTPLPGGEAASLAQDILGVPGKLLSSSKSFYKENFPEHVVYFNACVFDSNEEQIWWGDIDFDRTGTKDKLTTLGKALNKIYVTREHPHRFEGLQKDKSDVRVYPHKEDSYEAS